VIILDGSAGAVVWWTDEQWSMPNFDPSFLGALLLRRAVGIAAIQGQAQHSTGTAAQAGYRPPLFYACVRLIP